MYKAFRNTLIFLLETLDFPPAMGYGLTMTQTESIVEHAPDLADTWTPSDEDWEWLWEQQHDDFAENVMW